MSSIPQVMVMDGPAAGKVFSCKSHRFAIPSVHKRAPAYLTYQHCHRLFDITEYRVYQLRDLIFANDHVLIYDEANVAYSGPLPEKPDMQHDYPWERITIPEPVPDFITHFDQWWRRQLWELRITQDAETRWELQKLEYALARRQICERR